jgi:hypothetical protein
MCESACVLECRIALNGPNDPLVTEPHLYGLVMMLATPITTEIEKPWYAPHQVRVNVVINPVISTPRLPSMTIACRGRQMAVAIWWCPCISTCVQQWYLSSVVQPAWPRHCTSGPARVISPAWIPLVALRLYHDCTAGQCVTI